MTKNKIISTNLDDFYFPMLADFAKKRGLTYSSAIRMILIEYFDLQRIEKTEKNEKNE